MIFSNRLIALFLSSAISLSISLVSYDLSYFSSNLESYPPLLMSLLFFNFFRALKAQRCVLKF